MVNWIIETGALLICSYYTFFFGRDEALALWN